LSWTCQKAFEPPFVFKMPVSDLLSHLVPTTIRIASAS
jgi:hypothetical protein